MSTDTAEHMTYISTQENNANNEIPAGSASLQIQAIANSLVKEWIEDFPILWQTFYYKKVLCLLQGMGDESDEKESDRDTGAQQTSNRDAGAQQTSNRDTGAQQTAESMDADA